MKNLIKYGFIALVICFFSGCTTEGATESITEKEEVPVRELHPHNIMMYEGCEYIIYYNQGMHKGNCKNPIHNCR